MFQKLKVRDSKMLTAVARQKIVDHFVKENYEFKTFSASSLEIDKQGIAVCIYDLITQALNHFQNKFDFCLIDGNYNLDSLPDLLARRSVGEGGPKGRSPTGGGVKSVIGGDAKCFSIAAASIVAKVDRDAQMDVFDKQYPRYGFAAHKGYGTHLHLESISKHGPSPIHRLSFKPFNNN